MEYEIRFYYPLEEYKNIVLMLEKIKELKNNGKYYEKTSQFNHPNKEYDFYKKEIDGRFRIRITKQGNNSKCKISWKKRLENSINSKINKEEEKELNINYSEYDNLLYIVKKVLHLKEVESYERYRTTFTNDEVEISVDEYPFGLALEIESKNNNNPEKVIDKYIKILKLDYKKSYRLSWDDKYEELCKEQNIEKYNHVLFEKNMPKIK